MKLCGLNIDGKLIAKDVKYCDTFFSGLLGLMFIASPGNGAVLLNLPEPVGIHMNFVRFDLRIIWLDVRFKVVGEVLAKPWRMYHGPAGAKHVVELPVGNHSKIKEGDIIEINAYDNKNRGTGNRR